MNENKLVQVCKSCKRASCWYHEFMCDNYMDADLELKTIKELRELKLESEHYWSDDYMEGIYGEPAPFGYRKE